jgi:2-polyprenyl-3-methyl-5-hydroxy-6-metoxy-1,4-benzoquinol methylase
MQEDIYANAAYLEKNPTWHVEDSPWKANHIRKLLAKHRVQAKTIAEVGCGAGEILKLLSIAYPESECFGYEPSPQAYALCKSRQSEKLKYFQTDFPMEARTFDVLLCIDVVEHIEDYISFIKRLRPGAKYKVFHIPLDINVVSLFRNSMIKQRKKVGHIHYFTADTFVAALRDAGYHIMDSYFTPFSIEIPSATLTGKLAKLPRMLLYKTNPRLMATLLGGCSFIVLAE